MSKRGVITLVFDDGYERVHQNVVPLLDRYHLPAVFALTLNAPKLARNKAFRKLRPWQQWLHLRNRGHEIAAHSITHPDLTQISDAQLDQELRQPVSMLQATTLVYPGGAFNDRVVQQASRYYTAGRTIARGFETLPPQDVMRLKSKNYSRNNFTVARANLLALWAWLTNSWLIETYHMIDDDDQQMVHTVKTKEFARHLAFVNRLPVTVKTIQQVIQP